MTPFMVIFVLFCQYSILCIILFYPSKIIYYMGKVLHAIVNVWKVNKKDIKKAG